MLSAALRDMQWRRRRLVIAILSTGLVFAMTLVLTGLANGFRVEAQRTVDSMGVDLFVVKSGAAGPFLGSTPFAQVDLARVALLIARDAYSQMNPRAYLRRIDRLAGQLEPRLRGSLAGGSTGTVGTGIEISRYEP